MNDKRPTLFIDTNALADRNFIMWLVGYSGVKKTSVLCYMEYLTMLLDKGQDYSDLDEILKNTHMVIEYYTKADAIIAANLMHSRNTNRRCEVCKQINWNDTAIAAQGDRCNAWLVTKNIADFPTDPSFNVVTPDEAMNKLTRFC